jgi:hypothetical protein
MLSLSNVQAAQNGYQYFVVVSNSYGTATSAIATLSVVQGPPTITYDLSPASQMAPVGATLSYQVQANGTLPFTYLWYRNGTLVSGATASTYSFTVTPGSNYFSCTITNTIGSANSAVVGLTGISVAPPVVNFANTGDWTINHNASMTTAGIVNGVLTLTDGGGSEVATAFYNTPQFVDGFVAFFTYQGTAGSSGMADGTTFCIQNSPAGAAAIGGGGGQMGIWGIGNSAAVILNIFQYANGGRGIQFGTNGMTVGTDPGTPPYISTAPVDMGSGHPLNVRVYALGGIWHVRLTDATTGATFLHSGAVGNTFPTIGSDNAYVGFTGATGGDNSSQLVSNFRFSSTTPPVLAVKRDASGVAISWPVSVASFFRLQQAPSLEGPWTAVDGTPTVANLQNIVTVQPTGTAAFYRLNLQ